MNTTTVPAAGPPSHPTLAAALRCGARDYYEAAAVQLLIDLPQRLYTRPTLDRYLILDNPDRPRCVSVRWAELDHDLKALTVPVGDRSRRMLLIACSIAAGDLREWLDDLDPASTVSLRAALERIVRRQR